MKILKNKFSVEWDEWSDPGDYPNNAASGPLPSYGYVEAINGQFVISLELGDIEEDDENNEQLEEIAKNHADIPKGISVNEWDITKKGDKVIFEVADFDASNYDIGPDEPDYEIDYGD